MRWIKFNTGEGSHYGIIEGTSGEWVRRVRGNPFEGYEIEDYRVAYDEVTIEVPFLPRTFYCAGLNYAAHVIESAKKAGVEPKLPAAADIGYRANNALIAHGETVIMPTDASVVHYEGELVVVIGKKAHRLSESEALSCVLGYTIGNDVSERNWQRSDRTFWRAKNTDTFKPMGPWIDTDFKVDDAITTVTVNGVATTRFRTADMLFGIETFISRMSHYLTLYPGDCIWMGTDGKSPDLKDQDVVEVEISGLGTLRNQFRKNS